MNQIAGWVSTLGYDSKGNITTDGAYTYTYSSENRLTSLTNTATGAIQASSTYAYDPLMRLAVINSSNDALDADLGYDGQDFIREGLSGSRTRRYVRGPGVDEPLVGYLVTSTGTSRLWYQADERGSIARLSNDSGTPGGIGKFDEYGVGGTGRIRYAGQYWLGDGSLHYSRARIYDARLGRFLQPDPIGYGDGLNLYAYVKGDPVNRRDPTGLCDADMTTATADDDCPIVVTAKSENKHADGGGDASIWDWSSQVIVVTAIRAATGRSRPRPKKEVPHFEVEDFAFCSADNLFAQFRKPGNSAPGAPAAQLGTTSNIILTGGNPITQVVDVRSRTITNITQEGHRYHSGSVTIKVGSTWYGGSSVSIVGKGSGPNALENSVAGFALFTALTARATIACTTGVN